MELSTFRFIYCDDVTISHDNVLPVLYASKKYILPSLTRKCSDFLVNGLTVENVSYLLDQSFIYDEPSLQQHCLDLFAKNAERIFKTEEFLDISQVGLKAIAQLDELGCVDELAMYSACTMWARRNCQKKEMETNDANLRSALGDVINSIRFPLMSSEQFAKNIGHSNILTDKEKVDIYQHILVNPNDQGSGMFNSKPRNFLCSCDVYMTTVNASNASWSIDRHDNIFLSASQDLKLVGVSLYGCQGSNKVNISIRGSFSIQTDTGMSDGICDPFLVFFPNSVVIRANQEYQMSVSINGPAANFRVGSGLNSSVASQGVQFYFSRSSRGRPSAYASYADAVWDPSSASQNTGCVAQLMFRV